MKTNKSKRAILCLLLILLSTVTMKAQHRSNSKGKAMLQSAIYPGLGIYSQDKTKKAALILGFATYASLGASYYFHTDAVDSYDKYLIEFESPQKRNEMADQWELSHKKSILFGYGAAGIWIGSMVYTLFSKSKTPYSSSRRISPFRVGYNYNPHTKSPMVAIQLSF